MQADTKHPDISVKLVGGDGNVFAIIGKVTRALRDAGLDEEATGFANDAMNQGSYDDVLRLAMHTVSVR